MPQLLIGCGFLSFAVRLCALDASRSAISHQFLSAFARRHCHPARCRTAANLVRKTKPNHKVFETKIRQGGGTISRIVLSRTDRDAGILGFMDHGGAGWQKCTQTLLSNIKTFFSRHLCRRCRGRRLIYIYATDRTTTSCGSHFGIQSVSHGCRLEEGH